MKVIREIVCADFITPGYLKIETIIEYIEALRVKWNSKYENEAVSEQTMAQRKLASKLIEVATMIAKANGDKRLAILEYIREELNKK